MLYVQNKHNEAEILKKSDLIIRSDRRVDNLSHCFLNSVTSDISTYQDTIVNKISNQTKNNELLIYCFSEKDCVPCIKEQLECMKKNDQLITITDCNKRTWGYIFDGVQIQEGNRIEVKNDWMNNYIKKTPVIFILRDRKIYNVFYPVKNETELIEKYLNILNKHNS